MFVCEKFAITPEVMTRHFHGISMRVGDGKRKK